MAASATNYKLKKWMAWGGAPTLLAGAAWALYTFLGDAPLKDIPTSEVKRGEFLITLIESGEIQAAQAEKIVSPRVRGRLQILSLWPEGGHVDVGDLVLQFDKTEFEKWLRDRAGELEKAQSDFTRARAEKEQKLFELNIQIEQNKASLGLARINLKKAELGTRMELEEARIGFKQAERSLSEARGNLEAEQLAAQVDLQNHQLNIARWQKYYDNTLRDYERLDVYATHPGIVVYEKIRRPEGVRKIKVGDQVWGGRTLISLPDLSRIQVIVQVGEMDVKRVKEGQKAFVRLDAYPGPVFHGQVTKVFSMANPSLNAPNVQVFEMIIDIEEEDARLKPGMSAAAEIVLETIPDALSIPLEAVFHQEGKSVVYHLDGDSFEPLEVELGKRNTTSTVVKSGLEEGERIALKRPSPVLKRHP